jgi:hypothetical protein
MKILLDENLPRKLKFNFTADHELFTVQEMNWLGKRNGELLGLMTLNGFDAFVTIDKNLQHQQNLNRFAVRLFVLNARNNKIETLEPYIEKLSEALALSINDQVVIVDIDQ